MKAITKNTLVTNSYGENAIKLPIAHGEGKYFADDSILQSLIKNDQILFKYCDASGNATDGANPNGSLMNIAGICNRDRNVFGMMPHPERAADKNLANQDGKALFDSIIKCLSEV